MPRANRHFLPGLVWHLTHRCHERNFLLKFTPDRNNYLRWRYETCKRFGLCVLDSRRLRTFSRHTVNGCRPPLEGRPRHETIPGPNRLQSEARALSTR